MEKIIRYLKTSKHVLITSHTEPDGDAIGSMTALGLSLQTLKIYTTLYNESSIPMVFRFLPEVEKIQRQVPDSISLDTVMVLDCGNIDRIGKLAEKLTQKTKRPRPVIINIDHHATNTFFGDYCLVDSGACATAEIIYRFIKKMLIVINPAIATAIYTGILTDTGSFRFNNTNRASFAICDEMVAAGVEPHTVASYVYGTYSLGRIKLMNLALNTLELSDNGKLSLMTITQDMLRETQTRAEDIDGIINYGRIIEDVKVAVLMQENGGLVHVSLRSDGGIDVGSIAASFGGGGHRAAAGFSVAMAVSDLKATLFNLAEEL